MVEAQQQTVDSTETVMEQVVTISTSRESKSKSTRKGSKNASKNVSKNTSKHSNHKASQKKKNRRKPVRKPNFDVEQLFKLTEKPSIFNMFDVEILKIGEKMVDVKVVQSGQDIQLSKYEFSEKIEDLKVGQKVSLKLAESEKNKKKVYLGGAASVHQLAVWQKVEEAYLAKTEVVALITAQVKGGYSAAVFAENENDLDSEDIMRAFIPKSAATHQKLHRSNSPVGETDKFVITEWDKNRANLVISRRDSLKKRFDAQNKAAWAAFKEGETITGVVQSILDYGAFISFNNIDGFMHVSDLSWDRKTRLKDVLTIGQNIEVQILSVDREKQKLKVGRKQLIANPWKDMSDILVAGHDIEGDVVSLTDFGAFVQIAAGVEGLVHVSEISWQRVKHASDKLSIGDRVKARILEVDLKKEKISLSMRSLEQNPYEAIQEKFPAGTVLKVEVKSLTSFGAFVALDQNVDGMVHIGEFSWIKRIEQPSDMLKVGEEIDIVVLNVDIEKQRVACSIKQLEENPMQAWQETYKVGSRHTLRVSQTIDAGVNFELAEEGLSSFCSKRDLSSEPIERVIDLVKVGDTLEVEVIDFDQRKMQVVFSAKKVVEGDTKAAYKEYQKNSTSESSASTTLGDMLKGELILDSAIVTEKGQLSMNLKDS